MSSSSLTDSRAVRVCTSETDSLQERKRSRPPNHERHATHTGHRRTLAPLPRTWDEDSLSWSPSRVVGREFTDDEDSVNGSSLTLARPARAPQRGSNDVRGAPPRVV